MTSGTPESIFAEYLAKRDSGEAIDFDDWVKAHPEHEAELRALYQGYLLVEGGKPPSLSFFKSTERDRPKPAPGLEEGKVIGDFRLISLIGTGGMGQVWEAEQLSLRRTVALKFVRPDRISSKQLSYFEREARAGGRLNHPGIVSVYGFGESDGVAWIAMELVDGCWTLRDFLDDALKQDQLPDDYDRNVAEFIVQLAEALHAAHEQGVIHRDLKPQNILITKEERPKITDFGLARITDESGLSVTGDFAGTYYYMSPEQVAAKRIGIDHRTDIFSLGVVMYELLTLRRPFEGDTSQQVARKIVLHDPPDVRTIRSRVPRDLVVICGKALEKDPDRRYVTAGDVARDLRRHLRDEPILARPPGKLERLTKWARRHPTRAVAQLGLLLVVVLVVGAGAMLKGYAGRLRDRESALELLNDQLVEREKQLRVWDDAFGGVAQEHWSDTARLIAELVRGFDLDAKLLVSRLSGEWEEVTEETTVRIGDGLRLEVDSPEDAYVYLFNEDEERHAYTLAQAAVPGGEVVHLPAGEGHWEVDSEGGVEHLFLIASRAPDPLGELLLSAVPRPTIVHTEALSQLSARIEYHRGSERLTGSPMERATLEEIVSQGADGANPSTQPLVSFLEAYVGQSGRDPELVIMRWKLKHELE